MDVWMDRLEAELGNGAVIGLQESQNLKADEDEDAGKGNPPEKRRKLLDQPVNSDVMPGHALVCGSGAKAALLIPVELSPRLRWRSDCSGPFMHAMRTSASVLDDVGVASCYFPQPKLTDCEFFACLSECDEVLTHMREQYNVTSLVLLCDLNVQLSGEVEDVTGDVVHKMPSKDMENREMGFLSLIMKHKMRVCNTYSQCSENFCFTRVPWGVFDEQIANASQIDYVCASEKVICSKIRCRKGRVGKSDHLPVVCTLEFPDTAMVPRVELCKRKSYAGFQFANYEQKAEYVSSVCRELSLDGSCGDAKKVDFTILCNLHRNLEELVPKNASTGARRKFLAREKPPELVRTLEKFEMSHGVARKQLHKEIVKMTKVHRTKLLLNETKRRKPVAKVKALRCQGILSCDRTLWREHFATECTCKFGYVEEQEHIERQSLKYMSMAKSRKVDGMGDPNLELSDLLEARSGMTKNTANGGGSSLVNELLLCFPMCFWFWLLGVFRKCHAGEMGVPMAWRIIILFFIAKVKNPELFKQFRGVALLASLAKLFCGVLVISMTRSLRPNAFCLALSLAYTKGRCCSDVIFILNSIIAKIYEWRGRLDGYIFSGDVLAAFDTTPITSVAMALKEGGVDEKTIASWLELQCLLEVVPSFENIKFEPLKWSGALRQGGRDGPFGFNVFLRWLFHTLHEGWTSEARGWGILLEGRVVTHIVWSDNIFLLGATREQLRGMIQETTNVLNSHGMAWKTSECYFLHVGGCEIVLPEDVIRCQQYGKNFELPRQAHVKALGTVIHQCGRTELAVEEQILKGKRSFYAQQDFFCNARIPASRKFQRYRRDVLPVILNGSETWVWGQALMQRMINIENAFLRHMVKCLRKVHKDGSLENWVGWKRRHTRKARVMYLKSNKFFHLSEYFLG